MTVLADRPAISDDVLVAPPPQVRRGFAHRLVRGRSDDPTWVRPALLALLVATAVAYLWALGDSGWANSFYSAAVQAGTKSWKAFFFGSSDAANFITVDKPPAALWVMEISARIFGLNSWSILVPQALEGVATVAFVYATVRRWFSPGAALLAGAVMASTPVAVLMFRYNNPDALLVLLLTVAVYATVRAVERGSTLWLSLAMAAIGTGFITKMMQALLIVPAVVAVYLLAGPPALGRRIRQVFVAGVVLVLASGWWVAIVQMIPAGDRPYIGGSQNNSLLNLIFGYNGLGRLSGNESGSVGGGRVAGSMWGPTGLDRLFLSSMGGQISWLIPAVLILTVSCLWLTRRAPRTDRTRAALVLWGGCFMVTAVVFSYAQGIIHPYYNVALAPSVGALVGVGTVTLWRERQRVWVRMALALTIGATSVWAYVLLDRTPDWLPWLRTAVLAVGLASAVLIAVTSRLGRRSAVALVTTAIVVGLAGPVAYALDTVSTPHTGAIPSAGPAVAGAMGGPGGGGAPGGAGGFGRPGGIPGGAGRQSRSATQGARGANGTAGSFGSAPPGAGASAGVGSRSGGFAGPPTGAAAGAGLPTGLGGFGSSSSGSATGAARGPGGFGAAGAAGRSGGGGFLNSTSPGKALVTLLENDASRYTWVAATVNSNSAAGYQLATDDPVMAIGGFNGTDPAPSLSTFERYVHDGKIHYFIASTGGLGGGGTGSTATTITQWVEAHYSAQTVDGVTIYDLGA